MRNSILKDFRGKVDFRPNDNSFLFSQIGSLLDADGSARILVGALHGNLAKLNDEHALMPLDDVLRKLEGREFPGNLAALSRLNGVDVGYVPWMQATFLMVANKKALPFLPPGAALDSLTYDQLAAWAQNINEKTGQRSLGFPAGALGEATKLPPQLESMSRAVGLQSLSSDAVTTLLPIGLGERSGEFNNNVQVMMSLLNITAQQLEDAGLRLKLSDVSRRMQTMAIVHHQFYESEDMSRIDFAVFLQQLFDSLSADFPEIAPRVKLQCVYGEVFLSLEQATPAGLIVNELLTNAFKFAFPDGRSAGSISFTQRMVGEFLEVEVRDYGVGLPPDFDPDRAETLGLILIHILSEQLNGGVKFQSAASGGTSALLRFAVKGLTRR